MSAMPYGLTLALTAIAAAAPLHQAAAQARPDPSLSIELVDPKVLRVCADPHGMPFSTDKGEGFENKIAELVAHKLDKSLAYAWYPQSVGFIRNTLYAHKCDVIMGFPQGGDFAQSTNPYYRTTYALISKRGGGFDTIETLADPRLKGKRIGVVAGTPPATYLAQNGLLGTVKGYQLVVDTRVDSSGEDMMKDLTADNIDIGILWGPLAGYHARESGADIAVKPLTKETGGPRLAYRIAMGVRATDQDWKRELNRLIPSLQPEINRILLSYGVPLLDDNDRPIEPATK
jgi:quinoprotein dehydrogenase-associated probable ABC transporter substrate-binding protein